MPFRYLFKQLLLPPSGLLLLIALGWLLCRRAPRISGLCFSLGLGGLWLLSLPVTVEWAARALERELPLVQAQWAQLAEHAGAIVVLGGGRERDDPAWGGDQPSPLALERLRFAARLARASGLPLLASGGLHHGQGPSEAALLGEVLARDFGLPLRWREERSRTTWENARYSAELLRGEGIDRVVLVTQAWHMPRARWCFERAGLRVLAAPAGFLGVPNGRALGGWLPEARALWQSRLLLNEALGLLVYPLLYR